MQRVLTAGQVLTGQAGDRIAEGAVLVDGETIRAVGQVDEIASMAEPAAERLSYPDATLLPGLINSHVHLAFDAGPDPITAMQEADEMSLVLGMTGRAQQLLSCGVTTARDLGDRDGLAVAVRDSIARGDLVGPRILAATIPLTVPNGHCWFLGGAVDGEQEIRDRIRRNVELGADVIKVMASGGQITPGGAAMWESQFDTETLRIVVSQAADFGLPVAAHAHGADAIESAVRAGVSTIEHCTWMNEDHAFSPREHVADEMAAKGIYATHAGGPGWRKLRERRGAEFADRLLSRSAWLDARGVPMVFGTDAGLTGSLFNEVVNSLEVYQHAGLSNERIIELATTAAADAVGLGGVTGELAGGLAADLLVVRGDPLTDLTALGDVEYVLARGHQLP